MSAQISEYHLQQTACIYVRQSTMGQVRHHRESTERQYALREKALALGWSPEAIQVLDADLGRSGAESSTREDFKTLVAEVSMDRVGAVFALEVSRLARSNLDWHRLLELCALTRTLVIDEDGCYDPADFNDGLLLGLLVCGRCGRRLSVRYRGNGGIYPAYLCNWRRREALDSHACLSVRSDLLDAAVAEQVLAALQPAELELALAVLAELEARDAGLTRQWQMRLERAEYEAQLAERRYQEVDPANRLVAATLERRWNEALHQLAALQQQFAQAQRQQAHVATPEQRAQVLALVRDLPRVWSAPTTEARDRKRMLRLLIKDITVEKPAPKQMLLHIRWQGGACTDLTVDLPPSVADQVRYPPQLLGRIRELAATLTNAQVAQCLNQEGLRSPKGKSFTTSMIQWVRYRYRIPGPQLKQAEERTVDELMAQFGVSRHVVYYWIERGLAEARQIKPGSPYWIRLNATTEQMLSEWVKNSSRISIQYDTEPSL